MYTWHTCTAFALCMILAVMYIKDVLNWMSHSVDFYNTPPTTNNWGFNWWLVKWYVRDCLHSRMQTFSNVFISVLPHCIWVACLQCAQQYYWASLPFCCCISLVGITISISFHLNISDSTLPPASSASFATAAPAPSPTHPVDTGSELLS